MASDIGDNKILIIVLSTVLPVVGILVIVVGLWLCLRKKRVPLFNRGITPIGDDEIATWKVGRAGAASNHHDGNQSGSEKDSTRYTTRPTSKASSRHSTAMTATTHTTHTTAHHTPNNSTSTHKKTPSLIQYQTHSGRPSTEAGSAAMAMYSTSPKSFGPVDGKCSIDLPAIPSSTAAVLARAPNARSGLTDEAIPGDAPFLPSPKRSGSKRLQKAPPSGDHGHQLSGSSPHHRRFQPSLQSLQNSPQQRQSRDSRSSSVKSQHEMSPIAWHNVGGGAFEQPPSPTGGAAAASGEGYNISPTSSHGSNGSQRQRSYSHNSARPSNARIFSSSSGHHRAVTVSTDGNDQHYTILSPPPPTARRPEDIGRAIG